jgi:hypothetical protein
MPPVPGMIGTRGVKATGCSGIIAMGCGCITYRFDPVIISVESIQGVNNWYDTYHIVLGDSNDLGMIVIADSGSVGIAVVDLLVDMAAVDSVVGIAVIGLPVGSSVG